MSRAHRVHLHTATCPQDVAGPTRRPLWISRRRPPSGPLVAAGLARVLLCVSIATLGMGLSTSERERAQRDQQTQHQHREETERHAVPPLLVDSKVWLGNTEFGERSSWLGSLKPCSLIERIAIEENEAVVSLCDAMDSIGAGHDSGGGGGAKTGPKLQLTNSDIRDFVLAPDGLLLLEDDTLAQDPRDPAFLQFLNATGDCLDSSALHEEAQRAHWFRFRPHPDRLSWFNPSNWASQIYGASEGALLMPESHQVPCAEDEVSFGRRGESLSSIVEANERSRTLAFKVNFRASESARLPRDANGTRAPPRSDPLRVSKLKIGEKAYTQTEFDHLVGLYGNNLFQFRDDQAVVRGDYEPDGGASPSASSIDGTGQSVLVIDESAIQNSPGDDYSLCLDEAGCECGNEQPSRMAAICSFNRPLEPHEIPCRDPIQSAGYCNRICATSLTINMEPAKFSERYLMSLVNKIILGGDEELPSVSKFLGHVFVGTRRVDHNKYEITFRLQPISDGSNVYTEALGRDIELAQLVRDQLERAATKSFYGIKTISIKSSVAWRQNNSNSIFVLALVVILPVAMTLFAKYDEQLMDLLAPLMHVNLPGSDKNYTGRDMANVHSDALILANDELSSGMESTSVAGATDNLAMVDLDTSSTTGSTLDLLAEE